MRTRTLPMVFVALVAALALAAPAAAHRSKTTISISANAPYFHGAVRSSKGACKYGRTVKLYREEAGSDELLLSGTTNAHGKWLMMIGENTGPGTYYARAPATSGCKAARSAGIERLSP
jgi:hypothetical protein